MNVARLVVSCRSGNRNQKGRSSVLSPGKAGVAGASATGAAAGAGAEGWRSAGGKGVEGWEPASKLKEKRTRGEEATVIATFSVKREIQIQEAHSAKLWFTFTHVYIHESLNGKW